MRSLFAPADANGAAPSAPAAPASATGWDGFGAKAKMGVGIAAVIGVVALVVLPGYGDKPAPQQIALQTPTPSSVTEYVPASAGLIERATTFVTPNLPGRGARRYVPTDIGLYAAPRVTAGAVTGRATQAADGEEVARGGATDPEDRLASQLNGATVLPTSHAVLVRHPDYVIRPGDPVQCIPQDAQNSGMPGFTRCRVPEWIRGGTQTRGLLPPGTLFFGQIRRGVAQGEERIGVLFTSVEGKNFRIPLSAPGGDAMGRPGYQGDVKTFFWDRLGSVALYSLLDIGIGAGQNLASSAISRATSGSNGTTLNLGGQVQGLASQEMQARIGRNPVVTRDQGLPVLITVGQDLDMYDVCMKLKRYDAMACPLL